MASLNNQLGLTLAQNQTKKMNQQTAPAPVAPPVGGTAQAGYMPVSPVPSTAPQKISFTAPIPQQGSTNVGGPAYISKDGVRTESDGNTPYTGKENVYGPNGQILKTFNVEGGKTVSVTENGVTKPYTEKSPTTNQEYTPIAGSLNYFIQQAGGDRAKGIELYKKAQDEKPKAVIQPLSEREKEDQALNNGAAAPVVTPTAPPVEAPATTKSEEKPKVEIKSEEKPKVEIKSDDPKTVAYWTSRGDTYKKAVENAKAERKRVADEKKKNTTLDLRDSAETTANPLVESFLDTKKIISDQDKLNKSTEEQMLLSDKQKEFDMKDEELQKEIDEQNNYTSSRVKELQDSGTEFEGNRLNQVRGFILQKLAAKGVNVANIPPEQLLALSGEAGAVAFKDIYDRKEEIKSKIATLEKEKMVSLNDLRSRKVLNESQYNAAITTIKASASAARNQIDENFNTTAYNALFASNQNDISQSNVLAGNINALLTQYGISTQYAAKFASVLGAKSSAEAQQKIIEILRKDPELAKQIDAERKSAASVTASANYGLNVSKEEFDRKQALYTIQSKTIDDDKSLTPAEKTSRKNALYNSIFGTSGGGALTTSP